MFARQSSLALLLLLTVAAPCVAAEEAPIRFGAFNSEHVTIAAPPSRVWRILLDRGRWMPGYRGKTVLDGAPGAVGERARIEGTSKSGRPSFRVEEVLLRETDRRLVLRLADPDDRATHSFVDLRLSKAGKGTELRFEMYWLDMGEAGAAWPAVRTTRTHDEQATGEALRGHLSRIKQESESKS